MATAKVNDMNGDTGRPKILTCGHLNMVPGGEFFPRFFIGVSLDPMNAWYGDKGDVPEGQFLLQHQYAGHSCAQILLFGIFLPIMTGKDGRAIEQLRQFADHFNQNIYQGDSVAVQRMLAEIGPFELRSSKSDDVEEAFFRFKNTEAEFQWISQRGFEYVDSFQEKTPERLEKDRELGREAIGAIPNSLVEAAVNKFYPPPTYTAQYREELLECGLGRRTVETHAIWRFYREHIAREQEYLTHHYRTRPLTWRTPTELARWLEGPYQKKIREEDLFVALIYENSD
jgi:hypothetical protein